MALQIVPDHSSSLDDPREHAETISANHMDMCRFTSASDPGYQKISAEIKLILQSVKDDGREQRNLTCHLL